MSGLLDRYHALVAAGGAFAELARAQYLAPEPAGIVAAK